MPLLEKRGTTPSRPGEAVTVPEASRAERRRSYEVADFPVPNGREEDWRFTPLARVSPLFDVAPTDPHAVTRGFRAPAVVGLSRVPIGSAPVGVAGIPADRVAAVSWAGADDATVVTIPADTELREDVRISLSGQDRARVNDHLVIDAQSHSKATVVLSHHGSAVCGANVEIRVGDGADLTVVSVQEWSDDALHVAQHDALVGRDATLRHFVVTLGGSLVRINTNIRYAGPGGAAEALGVYFADAGQHLEHRLFVDHEPPNCRSQVTYKGALQGETAHAVWVGDVLIRASAVGTETYELNRNLVLTDGARADSVPNLEIETGEILGAGHASATGRFDDEQLFYLQARGIPEVEARRLVVRGFFADVINRIPVAEIQGHLMQAVEQELSGTEPGESPE